MKDFLTDEQIVEIGRMFQNVMIGVMHLHALADDLARSTPIPIVIYCPNGHQHIDEGEWATRPHKTHQCQEKTCKLEWRPSKLYTVGVKEL